MGIGNNCSTPLAAQSKLHLRPGAVALACGRRSSEAQRYRKPALITVSSCHTTCWTCYSDELLLISYLPARITSRKVDDGNGDSVPRSIGTKLKRPLYDSMFKEKFSSLLDRALGTPLRGSEIKASLVSFLLSPSGMGSLSHPRCTSDSFYRRFWFWRFRFRSERKVCPRCITGTRRYGWRWQHHYQGQWSKGNIVVTSSGVCVSAHTYPH